MRKIIMTCLLVIPGIAFAYDSESWQPIPVNAPTYGDPQDRQAAAQERLERIDEERRRDEQQAEERREQQEKLQEIRDRFEHQREQGY